MAQEPESYFLMRIDMNGFNPDLMTHLLFQEGCSGIEEMSDRIWLGYFPDSWNPNRLPDMLHKMRVLNPEMQPEQVLVKKEQSKDWLTEWKSYFKPLRATERIIVAPPWDRPDVHPGEILVVIEPQMAFGTGSHETTRLMMGCMENYLKKGDRVLDAGTGSGILAILARKLGAAEVVAFDLDQQAIDNAQRNMRLNGIDDIRLVLSDVPPPPDTAFDVVLANINRTVLTDMLTALIISVRTNGHLILSGLLGKDEKPLKKIIRDDLQTVQKMCLGEWIALVIKKN